MAETPTVDVDAIAERSHRRVFDRLAADAPCKGDEAVRCPFCDRALEVRRTILGRLDDLADARPHVDGVQMKCAGDEGCGFRPDFDVPISREAWERERARRDGERVIDMGYTPTEGASMQERLRALGYLPEH